jgi:hypothetical protein
MRMTEEEYAVLIHRQAIASYSKPISQTSPQASKRGQANTVTATADKKQPQAAKQTKAEMEYGRMLALEYPGAIIIPWGVTLRMQNSHKYTPDFLIQRGGWMMLVEVKQRGKNGFRQNSYQRAKVAFDQCRVEFPAFTYRWAEKQSGTWNEHKY